MNNQFAPGMMLNQRFLVQKLLGTAGQGAVYLVADQSDRGTLWALKALTLDPTEPPDELLVNRDLFKQESELIRGFQHPNIVSFRDYFTHDNGTPCLVMEYIQGEPLDNKLARQPGGFSEDEVLSWAVQLARALQYLHTEQTPPVIYRDLKPANLMLRPDGQIKLIDFGIARRHRLNRRHNTHLMGTPLYSPPEAYGVDVPHWGPSDERSDVYSFGATLYHLLIGIEPVSFEIDLKNLKVARPTLWPPDLSRLKSGLAPGTVELVAKAMGYEKHERWQDFGAVLQHIESFKPGLRVEVKPVIKTLPTSGPTIAATVVCSRCGNQVISGRRFCGKCGNPLTTANPPGNAPQLLSVNLAGLPPTTITQLPFLMGKIIEGNPPPGLDLTRLDLIGGVSRRHAEIRLDASGYLIVDLGSTNGTKVNDHTLTPNIPRPLLKGDRIKLGPQLEFRFV